MLVVSCGDLDNVLGEDTEPYRVPLDVYMKYEQDENGNITVKISNINIKIIIKLKNAKKQLQKLEIG